MWKWFALAALLFAILGVAGWKMLGPKVAFGPKPPEWRTDAVSRGDIQVSVTATGTIAPVRTVMVGAQISGKVKDVLKYANDPVKAGEPLARLETELLDSEKRTAELRLNQARTALALLKVARANLALKEERLTSSIERKRITIQRSKGTLDLAAKNRQRSQDLLAVDATTQTDLDIRQLEEANAKHDLRLMEIDLEQTILDKKQLVTDAKELDAKEEQANADIEQAQAALNRVITNLGYATIVSPIDGVVLQHLIEPGQTVAASFQTPNLFKVASDLSVVRVDAQLDEADIGKIKAGQEVTFDVDAYRGETFTGKVELVKLQSESKGNLVTYPVLVQAKNPPDADRPTGKLMPGMTAGLKFVVTQKKDVLRVPAAALRFIPPPTVAAPKPAVSEKKETKKGGINGTIFIVGAMGQLEARQVCVGETDGEFYEVLGSELKDGDQVVVGTK
jgi:HlyD family secretion protein